MGRHTSPGHGWFNGYYDNTARALRAIRPGGVRMTLTGQVFPIMSGIAPRNEQIDAALLAAKPLFAG